MNVRNWAWKIALVLSLTTPACTTPMMTSLPDASGPPMDMGARADTGTPDASLVDSGAPDSAAPDSGPRDSGPPDVGIDAPMGCPAGRVDLDGDLTCEYLCTTTATTDLPDPGFADANCDGIDGEVRGAIFVSPAGVDTDDGSIAHPVLTLAHAIMLASAARLDVYSSCCRWPTSSIRR